MSRTRNVEGLFLIKVYRETEIAKTKLAQLSQENILGFDIPVYPPVIVHLAQRPK
jgi:hypothetical protein